MKRRMWTWLLVLVLALGLLSGCGSYKMESAAEMPVEAPMAMDTAAEAEEMGYGAMADNGASTGSTAVSNSVVSRSRLAG